MAGTELLVEGLPGFRVSTLRAADSTEANSLEGGFQVNTLQNGSVAFVVDVNDSYRWYANSLAAPADPGVIIPLGQSTSVAGRWILIPEGGGGGTVVPMTQVRYVDAGTTVTGSNGSEALPFPTIEAALDSFSSDELTDSHGYTIMLAPGDYSSEDLALPGTQGATFRGMGGVFPKSAQLGNIVSFSGLAVTLQQVSVNDVTFIGSTDLFVEDSVVLGDLSMPNGRVYYLGSILYYSDASQNNVLASTEVNYNNGFQSLADVTVTGQLQIINGQVVGDVVAVSVIAENTTFTPFVGPETMTLTGSAVFRSCQCLTPITHTDSGNFVFTNSEVGNGVFLTTESTDVQMFGCKFGTAPEVVFSVDPGVLLLDPVSNYFWIAAGGSVTNGSVVVTA